MVYEPSFAFKKRRSLNDTSLRSFSKDSIEMASPAKKTDSTAKPSQRSSTSRVDENTANSKEFVKSQTSVAKFRKTVKKTSEQFTKSPYNIISFKKTAVKPKKSS